MDTLAQLTLFGPGPAATGGDECDAARQRMRDMIAHLLRATVPPWRNQSEVILNDGAFRRAMREVPPDEAHALWEEYDSQMERLYVVWAAGRGAD